MEVAEKGEGDEREEREDEGGRLEIENDGILIRAAHLVLRPTLT